MSVSLIKNATSKLSQLTDFGVGLSLNSKELVKVEYEKYFKNQQFALIKRIDGFNKTCKWLAKISKIKTINKSRSSYGLKHLAEKEIGYITNGVFIAAAIHCGFDFKLQIGSANVFFNMSEKSLKHIENAYDK